MNQLVSFAALPDPRLSYWAALAQMRCMVSLRHNKTDGGLPHSYPS